MFAQELGDKLSDIYRSVLLLEETALSECDFHLTVSEMHLVSLVSKHEGISLGDIAVAMHIARPTASVGINNLVNKGYAIKETTQKDGRRVTVRLTAEGKRINTLHKQCRQKVIGRLGNEFSDAEREILLRAIDKLNVYFKVETQ